MILSAGLRGLGFSQQGGPMGIKARLDQLFGAAGKRSKGGQDGLEIGQTDQEAVQKVPDTVDILMEDEVLHPQVLEREQRCFPAVSLVQIV